MDRFTRSYVQTALWSSTDEDGVPLDRNFTIRDVAPETLEVMTRDAALAASGLDAGRAGQDFWLTRNRHGAGFWDEGLGRLGDELTREAHAYGSFDLYVGDDGQIHGS